MLSGWQDTLAIGLTALAVGYLGWTAFRSLARKSKPGCGSCSNCPSEEGTTSLAPREVIPLETLLPIHRNGGVAAGRKP